MLHPSELLCPTQGRGFYDLTAQVQLCVAATHVHIGLCTVFVHHTSASLILCENADPAVQTDLERFMARLVPDGDRLFTHTDEGPDDMPSHVRSVLTQTSIGIPVRDGRLDLGTWQSLYLYEHRHAPHTRRVSITLVGDAGRPRT
ncbi:MAG TPA: secondary thiamine-phosphate synthase enzyme YjbQ [Polyangiales bacterium]